MNQNKRRVDQGDAAVRKKIQFHESKIGASTGIYKEWHYRNWNLLTQGFLETDELIELAIGSKISLDPMLCKVRRGSQFGEGVELCGQCVLDGERIKIGAGTILNSATLSGDDIEIGEDCQVTGKIDIGNLVCGLQNTLDNISGINPGKIILGKKNIVSGVRFDNTGAGRIIIGNRNHLNTGLSINCLFRPEVIYIGHHNDLGRDGGGVISTAYGFSKGWDGPVCIGKNVETTRGAEILGFSIIGWPINLVNTVTHEQGKMSVPDLFRHGDIRVLHKVMHCLIENGLSQVGGIDTMEVSLFGAMKIKRSFLSPKIKLKDQAKVTWSYLENVNIAERTTILFSYIASKDKKVMRIQKPGLSFENREITQPLNWDCIPMSVDFKGYPKGDEEYYAHL